MRKFLCAILSCFLIPTVTPSVEDELKTVKPNDCVEHLFTHCLISNPELGFEIKNPYAKHLDRDCLTPQEFKNVLLALYENGYALVDIHRTFTTENGVSKRKEFSFPKEKKPLVLSFDDVTYASKNEGKGMSEKLVYENGRFYAVTEGKRHEEEFLPILERFIENHPDFSYDGARGIMFLTGFEGVFGYRTQRDSPTKEREEKEAKRLAKALKEHGWRFGCHSYAHAHMKKCTVDKVRQDTEKWQKEVAPIVGTTTLYAYPYGEWTLLDERADELTKHGFSVFFGVGSDYFYTGMPLYSEEKVLFQDRCPMDGISLRSGRLTRFFDAIEIYDSRRPIPFPSDTTTGVN